MNEIMKLNVTRGNPMVYTVGLAGPGYVLDAAYHTIHAPGTAIGENLRFFQKELVAREDRYLVGMELKHTFSPKTPTGKLTLPGKFKGRCCHNALYLVIDATAKEIIEIEGMCKGYAGEGVKGAVTIDTALDILGIEVLRQRICTNLIQQERKETGFFNLPEFHKPVFSLSNVPRARRRAQRARIRLVKPAGFDRLDEGMGLEDVLKLTDFYEHGRFY